MPPEAAVERYLKRRQSDSTESSVYAWKYRLKLFVEWCEEMDIEVVGDLRGRDLDLYYEDRAADVAPVTLEGEMFTLRKFVEYLDQLDAVEGRLHESVRIPDLDQGERTDETLLPAERALPLLDYYRESDARRATRAHALLELMWHTGARMSGLRALDVRDVSTTNDYVEILHRPGTGTPLKNKSRGERAVAIPEDVSGVLREYIDRERMDVYDDENRAPLFPSQQGRPNPNTVRVWTYLATLPCRRTACPHGREREGCEMTQRAHASKCPSSRSPHQVRTGSISWQLDQGLPIEIVAERVNSSPRVIEEHYDQTGRVERMERRRRHYTDNLELQS